MTERNVSLAKRTSYIALQQAFIVFRYVQQSRIFNAATQPDERKVYPCRPNLFANRIFKPANTDPTKKLPVVIQIHGGGFIVNNPSADDALARYLADKTECLVVSVDYRKAPQNPFPAAYEDIVDLSLAVIEDTALPVDRSKVVLAGNSAGGNLALAAAQDSRLRSRVLGVIGLYPVCDASTSSVDKMAARPDPDVPDILETSYDDVLSMYVGKDSKTSLEDHRLSPGRFEARKDLPEHVYLIGAEHDLLCAEAEDMADRLANGVTKQSTAFGWQAGGVRWDLVKGQTHGFDQFGNGKAKEQRRLEQKDELYREMSGWLRQIFGIENAEKVHL